MFRDFDYRKPKIRKNRKNRKPPNLELKTILPMTEAQAAVFDNFENSDVMVLNGLAGTGKTYISIYLSLRSLITDGKKIVICRSSVPARDIGFLPGTEKEKMKVYEAPYSVMVNELLCRGDAYEMLKNKNNLEFISTSYTRGITIDDAIVVVDEMQNMTFEELDTIITRMGKNSKIVFCGDYHQSDLHRRDREGLKNFLRILQVITTIDYVEFGPEDIVRSDLVKQYIIAKNALSF